MLERTHGRHTNISTKRKWSEECVLFNGLNGLCINSKWIVKTVSDFSSFVAWRSYDTVQRENEMSAQRENEKKEKKVRRNERKKEKSNERKREKSTKKRNRDNATIWSMAVIFIVDLKFSVSFHFNVRDRLFYFTKAANNQQWHWLNFYCLNRLTSSIHQQLQSLPQ